MVIFQCYVWNTFRKWVLKFQEYTFHKWGTQEYWIFVWKSQKENLFFILESNVLAKRKVGRIPL